MTKVKFEARALYGVRFGVREGSTEEEREAVVVLVARFVLFLKENGVEPLHGSHGDDFYEGVFGEQHRPRILTWVHDNAQIH